MTPKERLFAQHYLTHFNGSEAVRQAGYEIKNPAHKASVLLRKENIRQFLSEKVARREEELDLSAERTLEELARIAFADIRNVVSWTVDEKGEVDIKLKSSDELNPATAAAIAEITQLQDGRIKLKLHSKPKALDVLARHHGLLVDRSEVTHLHIFKDMTDAELEEYERQLLERTRSAADAHRVIDGKAAEIGRERIGEVRADAETAGVPRGGSEAR